VCVCARVHVRVRVRVRVSVGCDVDRLTGLVPWPWKAGVEGGWCGY
jgi:hypothetical protein